jgi:DNA polymerase delta subunit 1
MLLSAEVFKPDMNNQQRHIDFVMCAMSYEGVTYEIHVDNLMPHITIAVPRPAEISYYSENGDIDKKSLFADVYELLMAAGYFNARKQFKLKYSRGKSLLYYDEAYVLPDRLMVDIYHRDSYLLNTVASQLREDPLLHWNHGNYSGPAELFDTDFDAKTQLCVELGLRHMCWFEVDTTPAQLQNTSGLCQYILYIPPKAIRILDHTSKENVCMAPMRLLSFDIEAAAPSMTFPEPSKHPVVCISARIKTIAMNESTDFEPDGIVTFSYGSSHSRDDDAILRFETEKDMFEAWAAFFRAYDPDIITGWNINNFDVPYLFRRAEALGIDKDVNRLGRFRYHYNAYCKTSQTKNNRGRDATIPVAPGRIWYDMYLWASANMKLRSYTLNSVSTVVLKETKIDLHYSFIYPYWKTEGEEGDEKRRVLIKYCEKDAELPVKIMESKKCLYATVELARLTGVDINDLITKGQQIMTVTKMLHELHGKPHRFPDRSVCISGPYEGGLVLDPKKGFYDSYIILLDFRSLYPTIMLAHNISFDTLCIGRPPEGVPYWESPYVNPDGTKNYFVKSGAVKGVLYNVVGDMIDARQKAKRLMEDEKDPINKECLNARQLALKTATNAMYGFTTFADSRLCVLPVGASVTAFGREYLRSAAQEILKEWVGADIIYGDTDSVFVEPHPQPPDMTTAFAVGAKMAEYFNKNFLPPEMELECEAIVHPSIFGNKKKKYAYMRTEVDPKTKQYVAKLTSKGMETVRRDNAPLVGKIMTSVLEQLLSPPAPGETHQGRLERVLSSLRTRLISFAEGNFKLSELMITQAINKAEYATINTAQEVYKKMTKEDPINFPEGSIGVRIPYIITCGGGVRGVERVAEVAEHPKSIINNDYPINIQWYLHNQIMKPLERLLLPVVGDEGWDRFRRSISTTKPYIPHVRAAAIKRIFGRACNVCGKGLDRSSVRELCKECITNSDTLQIKYADEVNDRGESYRSAVDACVKCSSKQTYQSCSAYDCDMWSERHQLKVEFERSMGALQELAIANHEKKQMEAQIAEIEDLVTQIPDEEWVSMFDAGV